MSEVLKSVVITSQIFFPFVVVAVVDVAVVAAAAAAAGVLFCFVVVLHFPPRFGINYTE